MRFINNKKFIIIGTLFFALFLRLVNLDQSLWLDEAIGALAARDLTYKSIIQDFMLFDNHPPLYYLILKAFTSIFGYSEISIRIPSVIFGTATVYLVYLIANKVNKQNKFFLTLSAILIATSQFHIYYSQEARMYVATGFFASCAFYFLLRTLDERSVLNWVFFAISEIFLIFTDYVPVYFLPVLVAAAFLKKLDKKWWEKFIVSQIPLVIFGVFWLPYFLAQVENGKWLVTTWPLWKQVAGGATLKQLLLVWTKFTLGRISLINRGIYYLLIGVSSLFVTLSFFKAFSVRTKVINLIFVWLVLPLLLGFSTSFWFPAFIYFRFVYIVPAFYILVSWGISQYSNKTSRLVLAVFVILFNLTSWLIYVTDENQQREQWRQATAFVDDRVKQNEVIIFEFPEPTSAYEWYSEGKVAARGVTDSISAGSETVSITRETIKNKKGVYYFEYLSEISDPRDFVRSTLNEEGYIKEEVYNFHGVGFVEYYKL